MFVLNGNSKEIVEKFRVFGLCEYEARVYFALQVCGKSKAGQLWQMSGIPQSRVYHTIQSLEMKGLVEMTKNHPLEVRAKHFLRFANDFLNDKKCMLGEIQDMIDGYKEAMRSNKRLLRVVV